MTDVLKTFDSPEPAPVAAAPAAPSASARGSWMWDKERRTTLDGGSYNRDENVAHAPQIYSTGKNYLDQNGRTYWIDQYGQRHYN